MDRLRVLIVMTAREIGGAELYVERLVGALAAECRFTIAMSEHPNLAAFRQRLGEHARVIPFPFEQVRSLPAITQQIRALAAAHDVAHLNSSHPASRLGIFFAFALGGLRTPLVCVEHRATKMGDVRVPRLFAPLLPTLFRWSRRRAARVIAVSNVNAQTLTDYYHLPARQIQVVYNGIALSPYSATPEEKSRARHALRNELHLPDDWRIVLTLARLMPNKGHLYLIQAAPEILARIPDAHFVFAGSPDERAALDSEIGRLGLTGAFSLLGFRSDAARLLHASDVFVLPSLAEGFSLSLIEALASGLPVVATRVGGAPEVIRDGENGFLVEPANAAGLAQAVSRALTLNDAERTRWQQAALDTARDFSAEAMATKTLAVYSDAVIARKH
ncbi:MAG TPA: glycosyltransferase family 4 protein [Anaerolineae bacterium]